MKNKINRYNLKTKEAIENKFKEISDKKSCENFFSCKISSEKIETKSRKKKVSAKEISEYFDSYSIDFIHDKESFEKAIDMSGCYPLPENIPVSEISIEEAVIACKNKYKSELLNKRAKSSCNIEPVYLHTPEIIEAFMLLFKIVLQIVVLTERTAIINIEKRDRGIDEFMPNKKRC